MSQIKIDVEKTDIKENIIKENAVIKNAVKDNAVKKNAVKKNTTENDIKKSECMDVLRDCILCPRRCHANRLAGQAGYCGQTVMIRAARAALHFWEEPCISGTSGSGTVFFSGCNMKCVFCQNYNIALGRSGREVTLERLSEIYLELQEQGAHNINLVTPSHYIPQIVLSLLHAKGRGLSIPIVYNTSGYEEVSSLRMLEGLVDIYLPDIKYMSTELSARFSNAPDYFEKASAALAEMYRQVGTPLFSEDGLMRRGIIARHLVLPGQTKDSKKILRFLHETYGNDVYVSIMNQYTPLPHVAGIPELNRHVAEEEYSRILRFAKQLGVENGFLQEGSAAAESFIPDFDYRGL